MSTTFAVILCSILAVGFFVLGLSLTLIIKGHHIDSEISTNKDMQRMGIKCAVQETREDDGTASCSTTHTLSGCTGNCAACDVEQTDRDREKQAKNIRKNAAAHDDEEDDE